MPLYGVAQAGSNVTSGLNLTTLGPGENLKLFDGTETPASTTKSVAFARGEEGANDAGTTFTIDFATTPTGSTVLIQAANQDVDGDYVTLKTSTATQHDSYTDTARFAFYRAQLSVYSAGGMPVVIAQR